VNGANFSTPYGQTTILDISGDIDLAHSPEVRKMVLLEFEKNGRRG